MRLREMDSPALQILQGMFALQISGAEREEAKYNIQLQYRCKSEATENSLSTVFYN
jgi:hypothetical protein